MVSSKILKKKAKKTRVEFMVQYNEHIYGSVLRSGKKIERLPPLPKFLLHAKKEFKGYLVVLKGQKLEVTKISDYDCLIKKNIQKKIRKKQPDILKNNWLVKITGWVFSLFKS